MYERTLDRIRIKVRRYVARLSQERLQDDELNEFIFEAMRYDLAEDLGFNKIESTFDLITIPNIDAYNLSKISIPETNGQGTVRVINLYENFFPPAELENGCLNWVKDYSSFCAGNKYGIEKSRIKGLNSSGPYHISLKAPILQNSFFLYIKSVHNDPIVYRDIPENRNFGILKNTQESKDIDAYVNYIEGSLDATFNSIISDKQEILVQYKTYSPGKPSRIYFNGYKFHLYPIPDDSYVINIRAYKNPARLLLDNDSPEIDKWSDYIALAAAHRIFRESDNFDALARFEREQRLEEDKNIYRNSVQLRAKKLHSNNVYSNGACSDCYCCNACSLPKNPFTMRN